MGVPTLKPRVPLELDMTPKGGGGIKIQEGLVFDSNGIYIGPKPDLSKINFASPDTCEQIKQAALKRNMPPQEAEPEDTGSEKGIVGEDKPAFKGLSYRQLEVARSQPGVSTPPPLGENKPKRIYRKRGTLSAPTV